MKKTFLLIIFGLSLFLTSCGEDASLKLGEELKKSYTYDGKTIELEGYLSPHVTNMVFGKALQVNLLTEPNNGKRSNNRHTISDNVLLNLGKGPNSIDMPERFTENEVMIYDQNGQEYKAVETKVKITGTVTYTAKGPKQESTAMFKPVIPNKKDAEDDGNDYTYVIKDVKITKIN